MRARIPPNDSWPGAARSRRGFSLLELLVVIGLVAAMSAAFYGGLANRRTTALEAGQSTLAEVLLAARTRALASGRPTRVLVGQGLAPGDRWLRHLLVQAANASNDGWQSVDEWFLPQGVGIVPSRAFCPAGLLADEDSWTTADGRPIGSSALTVPAEAGAAPEYGESAWMAFAFGDDGAPVDAGGTFLVATLRATPPQSVVPVQLVGPQSVRGLLISRYGLPVRLNAWGDL